MCSTVLQPFGKSYNFHPLAEEGASCAAAPSLLVLRPMKLIIATLLLLFSFQAMAQDASYSTVRNLLDEYGLRGKARLNAHLMDGRNWGRCYISFWFEGDDSATINYDFKMSGMFNEFSGKELFKIGAINTYPNYGDLSFEAVAPSGLKLLITYLSPNQFSPDLVRGAFHVRVEASPEEIYDCRDSAPETRENID